LYDASKLEAEKPRLQTAINLLIQKEIAPFIPATEATAFGLQPIELPLTGRRSNPLDFYAQGNQIVLPVETLLFIEDLARTYGWLWANRCTTKTVDEYLCMLRYRSPSEFPGARYPTPLVALHVPPNSLDDPRVVEASVRLRRIAYMFMLLHEFGHLQLHHQSKGEALEEEADRYALEIMKNNSETPTGILIVMYAGLFFENGDANALHPISAHRLAAMAHFLDGRVTEFVGGRPDRANATDAIFSIARLLEESVQWLGVRGHREFLQQLALKTDPSTLQPRPLPRTTR